MVTGMVWTEPLATLRQAPGSLSGLRPLTQVAGVAGSGRSHPPHVLVPVRICHWPVKVPLSEVQTFLQLCIVQRRCGIEHICTSFRSVENNTAARGARQPMLLLEYSASHRSCLHPLLCRPLRRMLTHMYHLFAYLACES